MSLANAASTTAAADGDWSADANEALKLSLVSPRTGKALVDEFNPTFTYPVYGESQAIYGYKGLSVGLLFACDDMSPCVQVTYDAIAPKIAEVEAEDVVQPLAELLPPSFSRDRQTFLANLQSRPAQGFTPPGVLHTTIHLDDDDDGGGGRQLTYEVWRSSVADARCRQLLANMQLLVVLFIEGATAIDLDDEEWSSRRWEVFFLYEKKQAQAQGEEQLYAFMGYCTLYRYYFFDRQSADRARVRLSQFLILPPYQRQGHGSRFYDAILQHYLAAAEVCEITVEDPSEEFGDLRDRQDMARLERSDADFRSLELAAVVEDAGVKTRTGAGAGAGALARKVSLEAMQRRAKMPSRQFRRCVEMKLLQRLDAMDRRAHRAFRLLVKRRIYKQHADVLAQLDRLERIDKLDETFHHVEDDYRRLLLTMRRERVEEADEEPAGDREGKRQAEGGPGGEDAVRPRKKPRVAAVEAVGEEEDVV